ncbi:MAG: hypothetical protein WD270_01220 [Acetobacterales bacterium]
MRTAILALALTLATVPAFSQDYGRIEQRAQEMQDIIPRTMQERVVFHGKLAGLATACEVEWDSLHGALLGYSMRVGYQQRQLAFIEALFDEMRQATAKRITRDDCNTLQPNSLSNEVVGAANRLMNADR